MGEGQVLVITRPKTIEFQKLQDRDLQPDEVRIQTLFSGISAGTELTAYRGTNVYTQKHWDAERRLFLEDSCPSMPYPLIGWGYEEVGKVVDIGSEVTRLEVGDIVGGTWGHKSWHIAEEAWAADRLIPKNLEPIHGIFTHIGPIALNGILDAGIHLGETVVVLGLGVVGQIAARLAKLSGAYVIGVDYLSNRIELALQTGAIDHAINPGQGSPAEIIKAMTTNRGADVVLEATGSPGALHEAIRSAAYGARVVALGFMQGEARQLFLGDEFHHNRIQIISSQIGGIAPELSNRWDRIRLIRTILDLQSSGRLDLTSLVTHKIPFDLAADAYSLLDAHPDQALQVVLIFPQEV